MRTFEGSSPPYTIKVGTQVCGIGRAEGRRERECALTFPPTLFVKELSDLPCPPGSEAKASLARWHAGSGEGRACPSLSACTQRKAQLWVPGLQAASPVQQESSKVQSPAPHPRRTAEWLSVGGHGFIPLPYCVKAALANGPSSETKEQGIVQLMADKLAVTLGGYLWQGWLPVTRMAACDKGGISSPKQMRRTANSWVYEKKNYLQQTMMKKLYFQVVGNSKQWRAPVLIGKEKEISVWKRANSPTGGCTPGLCFVCKCTWQLSLDFIIFNFCSVCSCIPYFRNRYWNSKYQIIFLLQRVCKFFLLLLSLSDNYSSLKFHKGSLKRHILSTGELFYTTRMTTQHALTCT